MAKPTAEQLAKINKFASKELTVDDVFVFRPLMIDNQETAYHSKIHDNFLHKMVIDGIRGAGLLLNHNSRQLPVGRTFNSELVEEYDNNLGGFAKSVYGDVYIDRGRKTESNMTTDDVIKGIESGTIFDVSIGFKASQWTCSICGNDIRDYYACPHIPGESYAAKNDSGTEVIEKCIVIVGEDGNGELLELSLVYAGACDRAAINNEFYNDSVRDFNKGTKLTLVDNFKNVPLQAKIYQYYTKDGLVLFTETDERTNGTEYLLKRSGRNVEFVKLQEVLKATFGIELENEGQLSAKLTEFNTSMSNAKVELETKIKELVTKTTELETINTELAKTTAEVEGMKGELSKKDETISELTKANETLSEKANVAETYQKDLVNKALELGVRAQGNAFQKELFTKFLGTLGIDEVKGVIEGFEKEVKTKFAGAQVTKPEDRTLGNRNSEIPDKEDNPAEFSAFIADKAMTYAKESSVSIKEATKLMYQKYSSEDRGEA